MPKPEFVYVTYIATTPQKVWRAIVDPAITARYWGNVNLSDWRVGSRWEHRDPKGRKALRLVGKVVECVPPKRLVLSWAFPEDAAKPKKHTRVAFDIAKHRGVVRLTVTHTRLEPRSAMLEGITFGWPIVLSSLKTMLESGKPLPKLW